MPRRIYPYQPTSGVRTDFKRLMNAFLKLHTVRYEQFSKVWREKNMSFLCAGRDTEREAREFVEKILLIASEYFLPPFQFQVRVGGLYLLYGIYQIQPLTPKVKIRITPTQWTETVYFQEQAAQQNHLDIVYIFNRLLQEQAFHFCYTPHEIIYFGNKNESDDIEEDLADDMKEEKSSVYRLFNYESMEKISYLQNQYQQLKIRLAGPNASKPEKSLDVMHGELMEDLGVLLQTYNEKIATILKNQKSAEKNTEDVLQESNGSRRHNLKFQAFSQMTAPSSRITHNVVIQPNQPEERISSASPKKRSTSDKQGYLETTCRTEDNLMFNMPVLAQGDQNSDIEILPPKKVITRSENQASQNVKISKSSIKKTIPEQQLLENIRNPSLMTKTTTILQDVTENSGVKSGLKYIANGKKQVTYTNTSNSVSSAGPSNEASHQIRSKAKTAPRLAGIPKESSIEEIVVYPSIRTQKDITNNVGQFQARGRPRTKNMIQPVIIKCLGNIEKHGSNAQQVPTKTNANITKRDVRFAGNDIVVYPSKPVINKNLPTHQESAKYKTPKDSNQIIETEQGLRETFQEEQSGLHPKGNLSEAVFKMTNKFKRKSRKNTTNVTVTEIVVGKQIGQLPTVQSVSIQDRQDTNQIKRNSKIKINDEAALVSGQQSYSKQVPKATVKSQRGYKRKGSVEIGESEVVVKKANCSANISNSTRGRRKSLPVSAHLQAGQINLSVNQPIKTYTRKSVSQSPCHTRVAINLSDPRTNQKMGLKSVQKDSQNKARECDNQSHRNEDVNAFKTLTPFSSKNPLEKKCLSFEYKFL